MGLTFIDTKLKDAYIVVPERFDDERGFVARVFSALEFTAHRINPPVAECNVSLNTRKHTVRGMHFQTPPYAQAKLVRCSAGAIFDVIIDLRPNSETYKQWMGVELTASNRKLLYVPEGFAHGFQTLEDETEVYYQTSQIYVPENSAGVRWNDLAFDINWPEPQNVIINERDRTYPDYIPR